ETFQYSRGWTN
nr:7-His corazonin [Schistocerca americana]